MRCRGNNQAWGQVHEYLYLSTPKDTFDSTSTLLKYFLIPAGVLVFIPKYHAEYLCVRTCSCTVITTVTVGNKDYLYYLV